MPEASWPSPRRGEIWSVDWSPGRGAEQAGLRPSLIIQNDSGNVAPSYPNVIVAAISRKGRHVPFHVFVRASSENGLKEDGYVKCEQVLTVSKGRLRGKAWGRLSSADMQRVDEALRRSLGLW